MQCKAKFVRFSDKTWFGTYTIQTTEDRQKKRIQNVHKISPHILRSMYLLH